MNDTKSQLIKKLIIATKDKKITWEQTFGQTYRLEHKDYLIWLFTIDQGSKARKLMIEKFRSEICISKSEHKIKELLIWIKFHEGPTEQDLITTLTESLEKL